jgi:hypothetical protein
MRLEEREAGATSSFESQTSMVSSAVKGSGKYDPELSVAFSLELDEGERTKEGEGTGIGKAKDGSRKHCSREGRKQHNKEKSNAVIIDKEVQAANGVTSANNMTSAPVDNFSPAESPANSYSSPSPVAFTPPRRVQHSADYLISAGLLIEKAESFIGEKQAAEDDREKEKEQEGNEEGEGSAISYTDFDARK